jgi:hypothetical protein
VAVTNNVEDSMDASVRSGQLSCVDGDWCPEETLDYLSPRLVCSLAELHAPESVIQTVIQLLPFGSRAALESTGMVVRGEDVGGHAHHVLRLTPLGLRVIEEAAHPGMAAPDVDALDARAAQALASKR